MDETANPEQGSESPAPQDTAAAFAQYLERQANPAGAEGEKEQPAQGAEAGQPAAEAKPETPEAAEPEEQRFMVKINGEEKEVPLSELLKGYSLESDYRIKTSQAAEQTRAAQAQAQQAAQERQQYAQALQTYQKQLATMQPQAPDPQLIESDPVGYLRQQQAYSGWQQQMQQAQWEQQQLSQREQQEQGKAYQDRIAKEQEALFTAIPEWRDEAKAKAGKAELAAFLQKTGYSMEEVAQAVDHRAILMARKAMLYDQIITQQKAAATKVAALPPKAPQRPGSGETSPTDGRTSAMKNLKATGSIDAAANAFAAFLAPR